MCIMIRLLLLLFFFALPLALQAARPNVVMVFIDDMGPKLLPLTLKPGQKQPGRIWADAERLGLGFRWMLRSQITEGFVDEAIPFMARATQQGRPFYINLWPDDALRTNTLVLVCSDNGPELGAGTAGPFRGFKTQLYEGGVRSSLVVWGPGWVTRTNHVNRSSVFSAIDLVPTLLDLTGTPHPEVVARLTRMLLAWHRSMPEDNGAQRVP